MRLRLAVMHIGIVAMALSQAVGDDLTVKIRAQRAPNNLFVGSHQVALYLPLDTIEMGETTQTIYVHGNVQRVDFEGFPAGENFFENRPVGIYYPSTTVEEPTTTVITHCDSGIVQEIDFARKEYREFRRPPYLAKKKFVRLAEKARKLQKHSLGRTSTVDTGERREFFGLTARHLITTMRPQGTNLAWWGHYFTDQVIDGWYIDGPFPGCAPDYLRRGLAMERTIEPGTDFSGPSLSGWDGFQAYVPGFWVQYRPYFNGLWPGPPPGFPLTEVTTTIDPKNFLTELIYTGYLPSGMPILQSVTANTALPSSSATSGVAPTQSWQMEVTSYSTDPLDPQLFEIPPGFKKVNTLHKHEKFAKKTPNP